MVIGLKPLAEPIEGLSLLLILHLRQLTTFCNYNIWGVNIHLRSLGTGMPMHMSVSVCAKQGITVHVYNVRAGVELKMGGLLEKLMSSIFNKRYCFEEIKQRHPMSSLSVSYNFSWTIFFLFALTYFYVLVFLILFHFCYYFLEACFFSNESRKKGGEMERNWE